MALLLFLLVHCGGVYIVTQSLLLKLPREAARQWLLRELAVHNAWRLSSRQVIPTRTLFVVLPVGFVMAIFQCPACFGFWWALILNHLGYWPFQQVVCQPIEAGLAGVAIGAIWGFHTTAEVDNATTTKEKEHG